MRPPRIVRAIAIGVLLAQVACISIPLGKRSRPEPDFREPGSAAKRGNAVDYPSFGPKPVVGKQPPHLLLARDGTQCAVSADKFERTIIGTSVWCVWNPTGQ